MDFWWSDPHFGHKNIMLYEPIRDFSSVSEMTEALIKNYNSVVGPNDTCTWVGDAFFCNRKYAENILKRLNGTKILVLGNHDQRSTRMLSLGFHCVCTFMRVEIAGKPVNVSHYPYREAMAGENKYINRCMPYDGNWLLHGHVHSKWHIRPEFKMINVGVDINNFRPLSRLELEKIIHKLDSKIESDNPALSDEKGEEHGARDQV